MSLKTLLPRWNYEHNRWCLPYTPWILCYWFWTTINKSQSDSILKKPSGSSHEVWSISSRRLFILSCKPLKRPIPTVCTPFFVIKWSRLSACLSAVLMNLKLPSLPTPARSCVCTLENHPWRYPCVRFSRLDVHSTQNRSTHGTRGIIRIPIERSHLHIYPPVSDWTLSNIFPERSGAQQTWSIPRASSPITWWHGGNQDGMFEAFASREPVLFAQDHWSSLSSSITTCWLPLHAGSDFTQICSRFPPHREWIIDEILSSIVSLSENTTGPVMARYQWVDIFKLFGGFTAGWSHVLSLLTNISLSNGKSIQNVTALLLHIIQSCAFGMRAHVAVTVDASDSMSGPKQGPSHQSASEASDTISLVKDIVEPAFSNATRLGKRIIIFLLQRWDNKVLLGLCVWPNRTLINPRHYVS